MDLLAAIEGIARRVVKEELKAALNGHAKNEISAAPRAVRKRKRRILCGVPKCGKPGGGPKWGWFCKAHKDLSAAEKRKARKSTRPRAK